MASGIVTSNLVARSIVVGTCVSASRFNTLIASYRSYTTIPKDGICYDKSWIRILAPKIPSMSVCMKMNARERWLNLLTPDIVDYQNHKGLQVSMSLPALAKDEHNAFLIQHKGVNEEMKDGMLEVVTPPNKDEIMANVIAHILTSFRDLTAEQRSCRYYDMFFDRSILGERLCPVIAMSSPINSFSIYKKETTKQLAIIMDMPGNAKTKLTTQGLRVFLNLSRKADRNEHREKRALKREDVKVFFDYNTLFIEGKRKMDHYITGIHLPKGIRKKNNMIKRVMLKDGKFYAFIPCYVKKEERRQINDQLNK